jgi:cytoskeleton protein RodZ
MPASTEPPPEETVSVPAPREPVVLDEPSIPVTAPAPALQPTPLPAAPVAQPSLERPAEDLSAAPTSPDLAEIPAPIVGEQEAAPQPDSVEAQAGEAEGDEAAVGEEEESGDVVMEFSGPCWVDVRDKEGELKLFGEMRKGDRHVLSGTPPYSMIIGNAAAVEILVAGNPFDLDPIARGNVARFTLDPEQLP